MTTPTPRTEHLIAACKDMDADERDLVMRAGCRHLERDLAARKAELADMKTECSIHALATRVQRERAEAAEQELTWRRSQDKDRQEAFFAMQRKAEEAARDAGRWRIARERFIAFDWVWNSPPIPVAIFHFPECKEVWKGPECADAIADAAIAAKGEA